jgi:uncharacterized protein YcfL
MQTKQCKDCHEFIPKSAKRCKHCHAKQPVDFWKSPWFYLLLIIFFPIIFGVFSAQDISSKKIESFQTITNKTKETVTITSIDTKVTKSNSVWSKFAWVLKIKNPSQKIISVNAKIKWIDKDGFVIDDLREYKLSIPPGQEETFNGYKLIDVAAANTVDSIQAIIE